MQPEQQSRHVRIVHFNPTKVAVLEHRGDPRLIDASVRTFIAWRKQNHLPPRVSATFNIAYNSPAGATPDDFRIDLCAAVEQDVADNAFGIVGKTIPGGRCAVLRHTGTDDTLGEAVAYLCATWLPRSGEQRRDFPVFYQRVTFPPDVPEDQAIIDVFLPLQDPAVAGP